MESERAQRLRHLALKLLLRGVSPCRRWNAIESTTTSFNGGRHADDEEAGTRELCRSGPLAASAASPLHLARRRMAASCSGIVHTADKDRVQHRAGCRAFASTLCWSVVAAACRKRTNSPAGIEVEPLESMYAGLPPNDGRICARGQLHGDLRLADSGRLRTR